MFPGRVPSNPPAIDADGEQYIVEAILDHRNNGKSRQFLVHWEGYSDLEDLWVKEEDIDEELVRAYEDELEKENTTASSKSTGGRSARTRRVKR